MYYFSRYTDYFFDLALPAYDTTYQFFTLVSFLQGFASIPVLFIKTKNWPRLVGAINRFGAVIILVGAAPWLIIVFLTFYQETSVYVIFTWFYCIVGLGNIVYFIFYIIPTLGLDARKFFELSD